MNNAKLVWKSNGVPIELEEFADIIIEVDSNFELDYIFCSCMGPNHSKACDPEQKPLVKQNPDEFLTISLRDQNNKLTKYRAKLTDKKWIE